MGKKHKHPEHENLERWLVSYADFITLLFATFVVLYALSYADLQKLRKVSESIKQAFNPGHSIMKEPGGIMKGAPKSQLLKDTGNSILDKVMPHPKDETTQGGQQGPGGQGNPNGASGSVQSLVNAAKAINSQIRQAQLGNPSEANNDVKIKLQERGIVISIGGSLLFAPASAGLKPDALPILDKIAQTLASAKRILHVEGHTDNQGMVSAIYPSNWELSSARASSVVRYFINHHHFDPQRLAAVGYADTRPLADNKTEGGRSKNRRVDIVVLFTNVLKEADAGMAQKDEKTVFSEEGSGIGFSNSHKVSDVKPGALAKPSIKPVDIQPEKMGGNAVETSKPSSLHHISFK